MASEQELQSKIIKYLESEKWIVIKTITLSKNGFPDIFAFRKGVSIFIEVKSKNGKATDLQRYRIEQLQSEGFKAEIIYSFEQFIEKFSQKHVV